MERVRWGVLSTAGIATEKVIPAMQLGAVSEVVAIASRDRRRADEAAARLGIGRAYGDYEMLLADTEVDAVYNPLPNHLHGAWTLAAARAGKHVLCEKPLTPDATGAAELVRAVADEGVLLMEAFMYRHHPTWVAVRDLVAGGRIGELRTVQTRFSYFNDDPNNIRNIREYGGGALLDIGCYAVNAARMLFGAEPRRVAASIHADDASGVDTLTAGLLEFEAGSASFTVSTRSEPDQRVHVVGTDGRIDVEIPFNIPPDRPTRIFLTHGGDPPTAPATETITFAPADQYTIQGDLFSAAVRDGKPAPVSPGDAVANLAVIDRLFADAGHDPG